jgi:hypothetical protein
MATTYGFDVSISSAVDRAERRPATGGRETAVAGPLTPEQLRQIGRYWDAANYLTVAVRRQQPFRAGLQEALQRDPPPGTPA